MVSEVATQGFDRAAGEYERGRPGYPDDALALLVDHLGLGPGRRVLDLAAGTGKLTRSLVATGADVVAVEPTPGMREVLAAALPEVEVHDGAAEAIPLDDSSVDAVTVAQAFHWFDAPAALAEIHRVVRSGGGLGMLWNERDDTEPWVARLSAIVHAHEVLPDGTAPYPRDVDWPATVAATGRFTPLQRAEFGFDQDVDAETVVARALSTSYIAALPAAERDAVAAQVGGLVAGFPDRFPLPHRTFVYWCHCT